MPQLEGTRLGKYCLLDRIGEGTFGEVFLSSTEEKQNIALKVGRNQASQNLPDGEIECVPSKAIAIYSGGFADIDPVPWNLLEIQARRTSAAPDGLFPHTEDPERSGDTCYLSMEFVDGKTLRHELISKKPAGSKRTKPGGQVGEVLDSNTEAGLERLNLAILLYEAVLAVQNSPLKFHGDLKPDNIIISETKLRFLDPGYFGSLASKQGMISRAVITTPDYYPLLEPSDNFAAGCILWELCLGIHPLRISNNTLATGTEVQEGSTNSTRIGARLDEVIRFEELMGRYFFSDIRKLRSPREYVPELSDLVSELLLQSIGLEISEGGILEKSKEQASSLKILSELIKLKAKR